jgi:hypothetical protein
MIGPGHLLVLTVFGLLAAFGLAGGIFLHRISWGIVRWHTPFTGAARLFKYLAKPKVLLVVGLIVAGLALICGSTTYTSFQATTGYKYTLVSEPHKVYVPELNRILTLPGYTLWETPVTTTVTVTLVEPARIMIGLLLIIVALLIAARFSVIEVNRAYGVA